MRPPHHQAPAHMHESNESAQNAAPQHGYGQPGVLDQDFLVGSPTPFTDFGTHIEGAWDELWVAEPHFEEPLFSKVNLEFSGQPPMVETYVPLAPSRTVRGDLCVLNTFPQSLESAISAFNAGQFSFVEYRCLWPRCGSTGLTGGCNAIKDHVNSVVVTAVRDAWPGYKWPGCKSTGRFKTAKLLETMSRTFTLSH